MLILPWLPGDKPRRCLKLKQSRAVKQEAAGSSLTIVKRVLTLNVMGQTILRLVH